MFAIDESSQEILHYSEENGLANNQLLKTAQSQKNPGLNPPFNCGVYLFSLRFYEEVGFPARQHGYSYTGGASTPSEHHHSVASASGSELAKVLT